LPRPFEVDSNYLVSHLDELVSSTFADLQSQFLVLPKGPNFIEYRLFQGAYEVLRATTDNFRNLSSESIWASLDRNALCFVVLRTILGVSPPEWAELVKTDLKIEIPQNIVRDLDARCRHKADFFRKMLTARGSSYERVAALISVAVNYIKLGAPAGAANTVHRLAKVDTAEGLTSLTHAAMQHVPYSTLLYERYLGRPFASHRDSVSEMVGDVMESAIEDRLSRAGIPYRKTKRAEKVPGFEQAPDFFIPNEFSPDVIIEAKITGDDGTARDKATRMINLAKMRDERIASGAPGFQVVACIDGRGFGVRREDMRRLILKVDGKVFTLATLDRLVSCTRLSTFLPQKS
jgi:hypothetical protein